MAVESFTDGISRGYIERAGFFSGVSRVNSPRENFAANKDAFGSSGRRHSFKL